MDKHDFLNGEIICLYNQRKDVYISINSIDAIIYASSEKENKLVYKQKVKIPETSLKLSKIENIENAPEIVKSFAESYQLFEVNIDEIRHGDLDRNSSILTGIMLLNSKTSWGINSKGYKKYTFKPRDSQYPKYIVASKLKSTTNIYAKVEIQKWNKTQENPQGIFVEKIGNINDENMYEDVIVSSQNIIPRNQKSVFRKFSKTELVKNIDYEEDLTQLKTFSIDPPGCLDIDDALSIRKVDENVEYIVNIANPIEMFDVSTDLDDCAKFMTTSLYSDEKIYHLLPENISTKEASLLPNIEKGAISVIFSNINETKIVKTKIINKKAFSYDEFDSLTEEKEEIFEYFHKLFGILPEDSHELVEKSMIYANEAVAKFLVNRINKDTLLRKTVKNGGAYYLKYNENTSNNHESIGVDLYTHFTSPIRRYADQIVIRQLLAIKKNLNYDVPDLDLLIRMNIVKFKEKRLQSELNWIKIASKNENVQLVGELAYVSDNYARIDISSPIENRIFIPMISNNITDIIKVSDDHLENLTNNSKLEFESKEVVINLFWISSKGLEGFRFEWLQPPISKWLAECACFEAQ